MVGISRTAKLSSLNRKDYFKIIHSVPRCLIEKKYVSVLLKEICIHSSKVHVRAGHVALSSPS